jgi:hypothetical protein
MVPAKLRAKVVLEKLSWVERMVAGFKRWIRAHPERMDETL